MEITIKHKITASKLCDMFVTAFEGGSNYWLESVDLVEGNKPENELCVWWGSPNVYDDKLKIRLRDEDLKIYYIAWEDIKKGLEKFAKDSPRHFNDMMEETGDSITGDCFLQYIVFGEIVYG